jgi:hypothetical protein
MLPRCPREFCGGLLYRDGDGPDVVHCLSCSRSWRIKRKPQRLCEACGAVLKNGNRYCDQRCAHNKAWREYYRRKLAPKYKRIRCRQCRKMYIPGRRSQRYCGETCQNLAKSERRRQRKAASRA